MEINERETNVNKNDSLFDSIWNGQSVKDVTHLEQVRHIFLNNLTKLEDEQGLPDIHMMERRMRECQSHLEQIELVQESFSWIPVPQNYFRRFEKNADLSNQFREKGNMEYKMNRLVGALRGYNLAIMFGRPKHEETGLAYANRSAIFLQLGKIELALRDLDLAQENQFPLNLMPKLVQRRDKCESILEEEDRRPQKNGQNSPQFFRLQNPSQTVLGAEDFVHIDQSEGKGRRVIVDRDVEAGTLILMDKPFVAVLKKELTWDGVHCQFCLRRILGGALLRSHKVRCAVELVHFYPPDGSNVKFIGIPCDHCTFSMFCDDECRQNGLQFHQYEHKSWAYLHSCPDNFRRHDLLAIRMIEVLGFETIREYFLQENKGKNKDDGIIPGFSLQNIYDSSTYTPVHNLVTHHTKCDEWYVREIVSNSFKALMLTHLLQDTSSFFQRLPQEENETVQKIFSFTASLILRHMLSIPFNAIKLSELRHPSENDTMIMNMDHILSTLSSTGINQEPEDKVKSIGFGTAIYPLIAMCNHACSPNTVSVRISGSKNRSTMALITLTSLKAQEEVSITYGSIWSIHSLPERQQLLMDTYKFRCDCQACKFKWPVLEKCGDKLEKVLEKVLAKVMEKLSVKDKEKGPPGTISSKIMETKSLVSSGQEIKKFEAELEQVHQLILDNDNNDDEHLQNIMGRLRPCLTFFGDNFPPWFLSTQVSQQLFRIILMRMANNNY